MTTEKCYVRRQHSSSSHEASNDRFSSSPVFAESQLAYEPLLTTVVTPTVNVFVNSNCGEAVCLDLSKKGTEERVKVSAANDNFPTVFSRPLSVCTNCNICGDVDVTYKVLLSKDDREADTPYFPYLQRCLPSNEEMSLASSSPVLLVCTFCYHSLMAQWIAYETSPNNEDVDATRRIYNVVNYVCYICGVITYRNRIKSITVKDFPFLVDHPRPAGALSINGGESVITCLTCFDTLISQWRDFERMKVPLEMRKYNWIALPMPPDSNGIFGQVSSDAQKKEIGLTATLKARSPEPVEATANAANVSLVDDYVKLSVTHRNHSQHTSETNLYSSQNSSIPALPALQTMGSEVSSPPLAMGLGGSHSNAHKLTAPPNASSLLTSAAAKSPAIQRITAVSPLYQGVSVPSSGHTPPVGHIASGSLQSSRTSSFAAALRKLAKQAGDPIDNHNGAIHGPSVVKSHIYTPPSPVVNSSTPVLHLNSNPSESEIASRKYELHASGGLYDRHHISRAENLNHRTSPIVQVRPLPSTRPQSDAINLSPIGVGSNNHSTSNHNNHSKSGFQPYRSTLSGSSLDETLRSSGSTPISTSSSIPTHLMPYSDALIAASYPYHPFIPPPLPPAGITPHLTHSGPSYRLDDQMYLERYSLLRNPHPSTTGVTITQSGASIHPSTVPSFPIGSRYSELLATHQERVLNEERQRLLGHSSALISGQNCIGSVSTTSTYKVPIQSSIASDVEKRVQGLRRDSTGCGSIIQGTPRDVQPFATRKPNGSSSMKPLNLSCSASTPVMIDLTNHTNIATTAPHLWRPQTVDCDDTRGKYSMPFPPAIHSHKYQTEDDNQTRKRSFNASYDAIPFQSSKKQKTFVNNNHLIDKKDEECGKKHENLPNGNCCNNTLPPSFTTYRSSDLQLTPILQSNAELKTPVVSKLDLQEKKLRERRGNGADSDGCASDEDCDFSDFDSDFENNEKLRTIITKGPPLKFDGDPGKVCFLQSFGLTTHEKRKEIEFAKLVKRKRVSSELEFRLKQSVKESKHEKEFGDLLASKILPNTLNANGVDENVEDKVFFMSQIGLKMEMNVEKIRDTELLWEGVIKDRERRKAEHLCFSITTNNLSKEAIREWFVALQQQQKLQCVKLNGNFSHFASSSSHQKQKTSTLFQNNNNHHLLRSQRSKEKKDFAQESRKSSFLKATQHRKHRNAVKEDEHYANSRTCFKWPGIEAIMDSYVRFAEEQKRERDFLLERVGKWRHRVQETSSEAELLKQKMNNLLQMKKQMEEERERYQQALDVLKKCLRQMR